MKANCIKFLAASIGVFGCSSQKDSELSSVNEFAELPTKVCQTFGEIKAHINSGTKSLVVNGQAVANINDQFCLHTVTDGTKRLSDGDWISGTVQAGWIIAIANVRAEVNTGEPIYGATFHEAKVACAGLSLLGKRWTPPRSRHVDAVPRASSVSRSIQQLGEYLQDPAPYNAYRFWSSSASASLGRGLWYFLPDVGVGNTNSHSLRAGTETTTRRWDARLGVRCVEEELTGGQ